MDEAIYESIEGNITGVIYRNPENGYAVVRLKCDIGTVTAVGTIPLAIPGERVLMEGKWVNHASYGQQFKAEYVERFMPEGTAAILAYLSSGVIKGLGEKTAQRIVDTFGGDTLEVMEHQPEKLTVIKGITTDKALSFSAALKKQVGLRTLTQVLSAHGLSAVLAMKLYASFGDGAMEILRADPYILTQPQYAAPFTPVDDFALSEGIEQHDIRRCAGAILFELRHNLSNGHVFLPKNKLIAASAQLIDIDERYIQDAFTSLTQREDVILSPVAGEEACYLPALYKSETTVAKVLLNMARWVDPDPRDTGHVIEEIQKRLGISYAREQAQAIALAARSRVMLLTGGPGTGKTTTIKGIIELYGEMGLKVALTAPTGRAAKRMSELSSVEAATIHRLLQAQSGNGTAVFVKNASNRLDVGAVIMDETSMVDIELMSALLQALPEGCRLVMIGDSDQLPSVGPGRLLSDLIRSEAIPCVRLTQVFRQAQNSGIVQAAHGICRGEAPQRRQGEDMFILPRIDPEEAARTAVELCAVRLPGKMGIPADKIQLITPTRKGPCGSVNLNILLREALNPPDKGKAEIRTQDTLFREGDRVMQIRNNYDLPWLTDGPGIAGLGVLNGDIGVIKEIDSYGGFVTVEYDDHRIQYTPDDLSDLEAAWAITVHKAQGSEFAAVVFAACAVPRPLEIRSLFYTGVTRAKELLVIAGDEATIGRMCQNDKQRNRYSGLRARLVQGV